MLGLAATLSLWYLSAEDANPCYLASVAAAVLVDQLLQVRQGQGGPTACSTVVCGTLFFGGPFPPCYLATACLLQGWCSLTHSQV